MQALWNQSILSGWDTKGFVHIISDLLKQTTLIFLSDSIVQEFHFKNSRQWSTVKIVGAQCWIADKKGSCMSRTTEHTVREIILIKK